MTILRDPALYDRIDAEISEALAYHLVVDMSQPPNLSLSLSLDKHPPEVRQESFSKEAIDYMARATPLSEFSDGVQIYIGLVTALESLPQVLLLIDEPEAFLHPTLARRLGGRLARSAKDRKANLVAATHSADFLMGCIGEVAETDIVRLGYDRGVATAYPLAGADVATLVADPLLRSTDALSALFARGAVVCEADSDRALYEEINRRLVGARGRTGADDTVFLNAQNWQTIVRIAGPLRKLGIPTAGVLDLDALTHDDHWAHLLMCFCPDQVQRNILASQRRVARDVLLAMGSLGRGDRAVLRCKADGLAGIANALDRSKVEAALEQLARFGLFVVPVGELENWLASLGVTNKKTWVTDVLGRLGSRGSQVYVEPGEGDVWSFVESIASWLIRSVRDGMP